MTTQDDPDVPLDKLLQVIDDAWGASPHQVETLAEAIVALEARTHGRPVVRSIAMTVQVWLTATLACLSDTSLRVDTRYRLACQASPNLVATADITEATLTKAIDDLREDLRRTETIINNARLHPPTKEDGSTTRRLCQRYTTPAPEAWLLIAEAMHISAEKWRSLLFLFTARRGRSPAFKPDDLWPQAGLFFVVVDAIYPGVARQMTYTRVTEAIRLVARANPDATAQRSSGQSAAVSRRKAAKPVQTTALWTAIAAAIPTQFNCPGPSRMRRVWSEHRGQVKPRWHDFEPLVHKAMLPSDEFLFASMDVIEPRWVKALIVATRSCLPKQHRGIATLPMSDAFKKEIRSLGLSGTGAPARGPKPTDPATIVGGILYKLEHQTGWRSLRHGSMLNKFYVRWKTSGEIHAILDLARRRGLISEDRFAVLP
jgi:hypothetical protein